MAIDVPGFDVEQKGAIDLAGMFGVGKTLVQFGVALDLLGAAPDFDALPVYVVHQEDEGLRVLGQVAEHDSLACHSFKVARLDDERQCAWRRWGS